VTERFAPPAWLLGLVGLLLAFAYTYGLVSAPLKWDEQRRCQIAIEMIRSGDYLVPRLHGETYFNKPPLQNWLIVALSGNDAARVGKLPVRSVTPLRPVRGATCWPPSCS
jgi:4-amino-4-deoxy-L-arabinose transferase-like glycosyltransferase